MIFSKWGFTKHIEWCKILHGEGEREHSIGVGHTAADRLRNGEEKENGKQMSGGYEQGN